MEKLYLINKIKNLKDYYIFYKKQMIENLFYMETIRILLDNIKEYYEQIVAKKILSNLDSISNKNIIRLFKLAEKLTDEEDKAFVRHVRRCIEENHPAREIAKRILTSLSPNCRAKLVENFFINGLLLSWKRRTEFSELHGVVPPYLLVISPTMRCNLNCAGCYSRSYSAKDELNFSELDGILEEAKGMGIYFITISGGEPFIRKDLLDLYEKHNDLFFHVYSNGTLIDSGMAGRLERLGNVAIMISLEVWQQEYENGR